MIGTTKNLILRAAVCVVMVLGMAASPVFAQSFLSSIESVVGPLVPNCGLASTFRSEVGTGLSLVSIEKAQLSGGALNALVQRQEINLRPWANLNQSPVRFDVYTNFRFWRLGARAQWSRFEDRSLSPDLGTFDFTNLRLGADFDAVQHCWLALGASVDFYLANPEFRGFVREHTNATTNRGNIDLSGKRPATIGAYARYIPPEILNMPVHAELYAKFPLYGSPLTQYGGALVFRPQIYRFDTAIKGVLEYSRLKVLGDADVPNPGNPFNPYPPYTLDTEWFRYGLELAIYF